MKPAQRDGRRRLVALDVDGTLLTSAETLSPRTRRSLRAAADAGWHIALVTGRPLPFALPVARELGVGEFVVAANGGTVAAVESGTVLFQADLPGWLVLDALAAARQVVPGLRSAVTTGRGFMSEPGFDVLAPPSKAGARVVADATPRRDDTVHSVVLFSLHADTMALMAKIAAVMPEGVSVSPSGLTGSVELTAPGVHKGTGLARLGERLGVEQRDVVAFGDGLNDHEMLLWAGHGVAMGNAGPLTKALADEITASNDDDGVALVVERLLDECTAPRLTMDVPA